ncbi:MAG: HPr family phosphocarrier protein [Lachnospiraceae bacterium]|nr:HPr family phosphocarrier protein [Lachnospiraceae bacterium]
MITKDMTIEISTGLEARLVAVFVQVASQFESSIYVQHDNKRVNAKSIMGMMTLGLPVGENITVSAEGTDEEEAIKEIGKYLSNTK